LYNKYRVIIGLQEQIWTLDFVLEAERREQISVNETSEEDTHLEKLEREPGARQEQLAIIAQPCKPTEVTIQSVEQSTPAKRPKRTKAHDQEQVITSLGRCQCLQLQSLTKVDSHCALYCVKLSYSLTIHVCVNWVAWLEKLEA
jgi:hypothetical protein